MHHPSIWELESFYSPRDVIIAGSGFAGLWSAYHLKKQRPAWDILLIDKNIFPTGASTRNAGFACFGSVTELMADAKNHGAGKMLETFAMRYEGIQKILETLDAKEIIYEAFGGYELITDQQYTDDNRLEQDMAWLNDLVQPVVRDSDTFQQADENLQMFGFKQVSHLVKNKLEGQLHPGKLVAALSRKIQDMGVSMLAGIELKSFETSGSQVVLQTNAPVPFCTKNLFICTNALAAQWLPGTAVVPARGQVLVTSPLPDLPFTGSFHYDEGYYYFRNLGRRVLLGGARNKAFDEEQTNELSVSAFIQDELERFLAEVILPGYHYTIDHRWSGIMGMARNHEPVVQKVADNCYCAVGLGGIGVAVAPLVGERAATLISTNNP